MPMLDDQILDPRLRARVFGAPRRWIPGLKNLGY